MSVEAVESVEAVVVSISRSSSVSVSRSSRVSVSRAVVSVEAVM